MEMNSFSETLRHEALPIWDRIFAHPFLDEIQTGTLPIEKFRYYVAQDFHYMEGFGRAVAMALYKSPNTRTLKRLVRRVTAPVERPLHAKMFELLEMEPTEVAQTNASPTNRAYVNHLLSTASTGGVGEAAAALLPCPWTYHEIGSLLSQSDHPIFGEWIGAYSSGFLEESTTAWRQFVDESAADGGPALRRAMRRAFMTSSRYEYLFWTMAYNMERWPN